MKNERWAGERGRTRSRQTGVLVVTVDAVEQGVDAGGERDTSMADTKLSGRDLDLAVALRILGWHEPVTWIDDEGGRDPYAFPPDADPADIAANNQGRNHIVPAYSTERPLARKVYEAVEARYIPWPGTVSSDPAAICRTALRLVTSHQDDDRP